MDNYPWMDLHDPVDGTRPYRFAHGYSKVDQDPEIRNDVFDNDWRNADYIIRTGQLDYDLRKSDLPLSRSALDNSTPVARFDTGEWPVEIRRVDKPRGWEAWEGYRERFIEDGRVVDPGANQQTTSEGQSYAMLRAVYLDDRRNFDELWDWTKENLQVREDALLAWQWGKRPNGSWGVLDEGAATDADQDAALALLFASKQWENPEYEEEAQKILEGIWEEETALVNGERVVVAGDWARGEKSFQAVVNPSYFAPYAYKIFAEADPEHPWEELADSSYDVLERILASSELGGEAGLAPNWLMLDTRTGELLPADELGPKASEFSYDASRIPWRIALDYLWFEDNRAYETLRGLSLPRRELESSGRLFAAYNPDGSPAADYESLSMYAGVVPGLLVVDEGLAQRVYAEKIANRYTNDPGGAYWGEDPNNYYDQNMAWFATAVVDGSMSNLWAD
jgi:endoglucanase